MIGVAPTHILLKARKKSWDLYYLPAEGQEDEGVEARSRRGKLIKKQMEKKLAWKGLPELPTE